MVAPAPTHLEHSSERRSPPYIRDLVCFEKLPDCRLWQDADDSCLARTVFHWSLCHSFFVTTVRADVDEGINADSMRYALKTVNVFVAA